MLSFATIIVSCLIIIGMSQAGISTFSPLISAIIVVDNTADTIEETLESLVHQSANFTENIQVIIVECDCRQSITNSCLHYSGMFANVLFLRSSLSSIPAARNLGLVYATGRYVNFLSCLDSWEVDSCLKIAELVENNEIDTLVIRERILSTTERMANTDFLFHTNRIVDLRKDFYCISMELACYFFKSTILRRPCCNDKTPFLSGEYLLGTVILNNPTVFTFNETILNHRVLPDGNVLFHSYLKVKEYYLQTLHQIHYSLLVQSEQLYGRYIEPIQYIILSDLQRRIRERVELFLQKEEYEEYCDFLIKLLRKLDDRVIITHKGFGMQAKLFCLSKKYNRDIIEELQLDDGWIKLWGVNLMRIVPNVNWVTWHYAMIRNNTLFLEGQDSCWLHDTQYNITVTVNNKTLVPWYSTFPGWDFVTVFGCVSKGRVIHFEIPLEKDSKTTIRFYFTLGNFRCRINVKAEQYFPLSQIKHAYSVQERFIWIYKPSYWQICPYSLSLHWSLEIRYCRWLWETHYHDLVVYRLLYRIVKPFSEGRIWLFSDRLDRANDNAEHLFRFVQTQKNSIRSYFCLSQTSSDVHRLSQIGKVIPFESFLYKLYFLLADKIITSSTNRFFVNAFGGKRKYMYDLYNFQTVFLQHGIIRDDISMWMNKYKKNIQLFITSAEREYQSLLSPNYGFEKHVLKITGLPRHDNLLSLNRSSSTSEKLIMIAPTWRRSITGGRNLLGSESLYFDSFKKSEYFKFYSSLITDTRLLTEMKHHGYRGILCMHPTFHEHWVDFQSNEVFSINHGYVDYQRLFVRSSLLVTDYSSIFFDFSLLGKPVVYAQFDRADYFAESTSRLGYFDHEKDGFGPVCYTLNCTVDSIIALLGTDCRPERLYSDRIENFFAFTDQNNSHRVYEAIVALPTRRKISWSIKHFICFCFIICLIHSPCQRFVNLKDLQQ